MAAVLGVDCQAKSNKYSIELPNFKKPETKKALQSTLDRFRKGHLSRRSLFSFIQNRLLKEDIVNILKANAVVFNSYDLKGSLCQKLVEFIGKMPKMSLAELAAALSTLEVDDGPSQQAPSSDPVEPVVAAAGQQIMLPTCNSPLVLLPGKVRLGGKDRENWKTDCNCQTNIDGLSDTLDKELLGVLKGVRNMTLPMLVFMLRSFGENNLQSGCRNVLALKLSTHIQEFDQALIGAKAADPAQQNFTDILTKDPSQSGQISASTSAQSASSSTEGSKSALEVITQMSVAFSQNMLNIFKNKQELKDAVEEDRRGSEVKQKYKVLQECCICFDGERNIAFNPCGHTVCCKDCAAQLKKCPICVKPILSKIELFYS